MKEWLIGPDFTKEVTIKLNNFGTQQEALSRALLAAKPLGICKITTSEEANYAFKSLASILKNGNVSMKIDIVLTKKDPVEET